MASVETLTAEPRVMFRKRRKNSSVDMSNNVDKDFLLQNVDMGDATVESFDERSTLVQRKRSCSYKFCSWLASCCKKPIVDKRTIPIGRATSVQYCTNVYRNQKYSIFTFVPMVLFNQFKNFMDMFFLLMASSQFIPFLRIGLIYTYWGPLMFVTFVTMCREGFDDFSRYRRDKEVNSSKYSKLTTRGTVGVASSDIKVGDLVFVKKGERVPADLILLWTSEKDGSCFLRTDQLDGETDWKKRDAVTATQKVKDKTTLLRHEGSYVEAQAPNKDINKFEGKISIGQDSGPPEEFALDLDNTMWANTVVASGEALGFVIYTGPETRASMNNSKPRSKSGRIDAELNRLTMILLALTATISVIMMVFKGFDGPWHYPVITCFRFILLFSYLVPISLRVNMDLSKIYYCKVIQKDKKIPGAVSRTTTIPEELGRISYLLTDKTGTLTQNQMVFKKLSIQNNSFEEEGFTKVKEHLVDFIEGKIPNQMKQRKSKGPVIERVGEAVKAIALCHNVTPVNEPNNESGIEDEGAVSYHRTFQAASPDEIALTEWAESMGLALVERTNADITLRAVAAEKDLIFEILQIFPFTSESKRMGIILREKETEKITFYLKGADVVMAKKVGQNDWLDEQATDLAKEGLRTLIVAKKNLTEKEYDVFRKRYDGAKKEIGNRMVGVAAVVEGLERDMELLCVTGVEDKLQHGVRETLEGFSTAGIKCWMLTGDKLETATCIAKSSGLFTKTQRVFQFESVTERKAAHEQLKIFGKKQDHALVIAGDSLKEVLEYYECEFIDLIALCPAVVCCRCSPEQKADVVKLIQNHTQKSVAAIGDGGNDVSMIQAADVGIGIVGKEGKQASLAADFSITQFDHVAKLLLFHGRNSYKRTAALSQFVMHRGLIISTMQAIFSAIFAFIAISLYPSLLMVLYATAYTSLPVFSLVLDSDITEEQALAVRELYSDLIKGRSLSYKTFFIWVVVSIYQGSVIMFGAILLFEDEFIHILSISFTALILTELIMIAITIRTWHPLMFVAILSSLLSYILTIILYTDVFDPSFVLSVDFLWKTVVITAVSCLPLFILKLIRTRLNPPLYQKIA